MSRALFFTVPGDAAELAPHRRMGETKQRRLEREWHTRAAAAWNAAGSPRFHGCVRLCFVIRRGRALDEESAAGSRALPAIVAGLKDQHHPAIERRMLRDDTPAHVQRGVVLQQAAPEWRRRPEVLVTVEQLE
jgi:hypothetical protein